MRKSILMLIMLFATGLVLESEAQSVNSFIRKKANQATRRAGQKADEEVTKKMNEAVDKGVENAFDKIFSEEEDSTSASDNSGNSSASSARSSSGGSDAMANALMKKMGVSMERPENIKDVYDYSGNIVMLVESWNENGDSEGETTYTTFMTEKNDGFAMEFFQEGEGKTTMIYDYNGEALLILTDDGSEKSGMVTSWVGLTDSLDLDENDPEDMPEDYSVYNQNLKKTGKSKKIAGYKCDEYIYDDEETHINLWITGELPADLWANMYGANVFTTSAAGIYGGFVMEMDQKEKATDERTFMQVREVNQKQNRSIPTTDYTLMSFKVEAPESEENEEEEEE